MLKEFRDFIARGNVMDMAVGIIIGAAFTAIVSSMVADLINPIIGVITGGIDFSNLFINLGEGEFASLAAAREAGAPVFAYGAFLTAVINFLIVAFVVFLLALANKGWRKACEEDEHLLAGLNTHAGHLTYAAVGRALGIDVLSPRLALKA